MQTARGHVGFIVKDRWLGVRGDTDVGAWAFWKDQPPKLAKALLHRPLLCAGVTWDGILSALMQAACALGHLPLCLAPGHLGVGGGQGAVHLL